MSFAHRKDHTLDLLRIIETEAHSHEETKLAKRAIAASDHLNEGRLLVVVAGEIKQGKSSLINALLEEPYLLPQDMAVTTAVVTIISYGEVERITVVADQRVDDPDTTNETSPLYQEVTFEIPREDIATFVSEQENEENRRRVRLVVIELPNPHLRDGLVLVDTPGVGGLNREHLEVSYSFIPSADVVVFVSDAESPLSETELDFLRLIHQHSQAIILVVPKIDIHPDYDAIVENNRNKAATVLDLDAADVQVLPVSTALKLDYITAEDPALEDLEDSNFRELEHHVWHSLGSQKGVILVNAALDEARVISSELIGVLSIRAQALNAETEEELESIEEKLKHTRERLKTLNTKGSRWQTQLERDLDRIERKTLAKLKADFRTIEDQLEIYLADAALASDPENIAALLDTDIGASLKAIVSQISRESAGTQKSMIQASDLNLLTAVREPIRYRKVNFDALDTPSTSVDKALLVTRTASLRATTGAAIGGALGLTAGVLITGLTGGAMAFALPAVITIGGKVIAITSVGSATLVGAGAGGILGGVSGADEGMARARERDVKKVRRDMKRYLSRNQRAADEAIRDLIIAAKEIADNDLQDQIDQEDQRCENLLDELKALRRLTRQESQDRFLRLKTSLDNLQTVQEQISSLSDALDA